MSDALFLSFDGRHVTLRGYKTIAPRNLCLDATLNQFVFVRGVLLTGAFRQHTSAS